MPRNAPQFRHFLCSPVPFLVHDPKSLAPVRPGPKASDLNIEHWVFFAVLFMLRNEALLDAQQLRFWVVRLGLQDRNHQNFPRKRRGFDRRCASVPDFPAQHWQKLFFPRKNLQPIGPRLFPSLSLYYLPTPISRPEYLSQLRLHLHVDHPGSRLKL